MIKVVVFDLDGVYFVNSHENFKRNLREIFGLTDEQIVNVYFKSQQMKEYKLGKMDPDVFWSWAIAEWNIKTTKEAILKIMVAGYEINPQAQVLVEKLKDQGIKIALCTNNFPERIRVIDDKLDFLKHFDVQVFSFEEGAAKPDYRIYERLIEETGVKAEEIVYFDDSEEAVAAAGNLGIRAFNYTTFEEMRNKISELIRN
ncbi:TPA: hypothetical protein DF272_05740 [Candidatus Falkowbacteria bacterium]|nr:hypothetical protein [Candidatus Falkowbacteria bacterium]